MGCRHSAGWVDDGKPLRIWVEKKPAPLKARVLKGFAAGKSIFLSGGFLGGGVSAGRLMHPGSPLVFLAEFFNQPAGHEILKFFVSAQPQHLLTAAHCITKLEICKNPLEQVIETEHFFLRENIHELIGDVVRKAA